VKKTVKSDDIHLYFDPATNIGFKNNVMNAVNKMVFEIENKRSTKLSGSVGNYGRSGRK
jgi:ABC-2 type transport system permease protein